MEQDRIHCMYKRVLPFAGSFAPVTDLKPSTYEEEDEFSSFLIFAVTVSISITMLASIRYAYFMEIKEAKCDKTYVLSKAYHMDTPDQYLVCVSTSQWPGSGTSAHVFLTLIGLHGSTQPIHLKCERFEVSFIYTCIL